MKVRGFPVIVIFVSACLAQAQQPSQQSLEAKKKQKSDVESSIEEARRKKTALAVELEQLSQSIGQQEEKLEALKNEIAADQDELAFLESPARTVLDVSGATTFLLDFNGTRRYVTLHGVEVVESKDAEISKAFRNRLIKRSVYLRCIDSSCNQIYLFMDKKGSSLNAELVRSGLAIAAVGAMYDVAPLAQPRASSPSPSSPGSAPSSSRPSTAGKDVHVKGYTRKDGTYVPPHTRSAPGTKKKP